MMIPNRLLGPLGAALTKSSGRCADSWDDEELESIRTQLPAPYDGIAIGDLKTQCIKYRKSGKDSRWRVGSGVGPSKGSRHGTNCVKCGAECECVCDKCRRKTFGVLS